MNAAQRRILRDFKKIQQEKQKNYVVTPHPNDIFNWDAVLFGPDQTEWEGSTFRMTYSFPDDYPHTCPTVKFVDIPFHPNIYQNGNICIDILQANWCNAYDVSSIMTSILSLLVAPNPHSPANNEAAELYVKNKPEYIRRVKLSFPNTNK
ncbi:ubiquitin conjugating protein, putative [Trichomonas vaginalis G3]|uniref:Ubiquitin conjugating protein, putative n=1 Tax=Trichomonas vaginalis (strain ATCC PRA-98 / G3) TaxID=412133 RepID=A2E6R5_TRIV3|nr:histone ubiquitination [Trichomonas vaginalis G3]EAY11659.1 ubiquitin conjugating protein, putative [Trichomonas vaginalis G3]KAI5494936.1 histone ubiquitination [Trichomonas vaginalis G3]|eukprot:XP_001323882.1 ubiquitin conjugating protein [Trichomonas vaginalis G3]